MDDNRKDTPMTKAKTTKTSFQRRTTLLALTALSLAACGGSSDGGSGTPPTAGVTRGAITAKSAGSMTVNGVEISTTGATVRIDDQLHPEGDLRKGMIVTVKGTFDDRTGAAAEVEFEHGLEGRVDDKGSDLLVIGGQRVHVDDSTEFGDDNPARLADVSVGDTVAVSGVPDDKGGLRATRIDDSPRMGGSPGDDDDFDVKGFVSNPTATSFQLRLSPDSTGYWIVDVTGLALPAGFGAGAYVEVHSATAPAPGTSPVIGTIVATAIEVEDRFGGEEEVEIEGIVTSGDSSEFTIDGQTIRTDGATRWVLGAPADLVPGVKVEAEGQLDAQGVLQADKVSFRPGVRITAALQDVVWDGISGTATILGIPVQLPSFADYDATPANGTVVELRGNPSADGMGLVALRLQDKGGESRIIVRALVTAKSNANPAQPTFTVLGFTLTTAGAEFRAENDAMLTATDFYTLVEAGRTVVKARARSISDVSAGTIAVEQIEIEGND